MELYDVIIDFEDQTLVRTQGFKVNDDIIHFEALSSY